MGFFPGIKKSAIISPCKRYRYLLTREWDSVAPLVGFVMLNPSTADAEVDDPTIRKCMGFAELWGFGGIEIANLYAFRSRDPKRLREVADPIGPKNQQHLQALIARSSLLIFAWGANGHGTDAAAACYKMTVPRAGQRIKIQPYCLRLTMHGAPEHPLYVPYDVERQRYTQG